MDILRVELNETKDRITSINEQLKRIQTIIDAGGGVLTKGQLRDLHIEKRAIAEERKRLREHITSLNAQIALAKQPRTSNDVLHDIDNILRQYITSSDAFLSLRSLCIEGMQKARREATPAIDIAIYEDRIKHLEGVIASLNSRSAQIEAEQTAARSGYIRIRSFVRRVWDSRLTAMEHEVARGYRYRIMVDETLAREWEDI